jgi:hypothetical protein
MRYLSVYFYTRTSSKETPQEIINDSLNLAFQFLRKCTLPRNLIQQTLLIRSQMGKEFSFVLRNTFNRNFIEILLLTDGQTGREGGGKWKGEVRL